MIKYLLGFTKCREDFLVKQDSLTTYDLKKPLEDQTLKKFF